MKKIGMATMPAASTLCVGTAAMADHGGYHQAIPGRDAIALSASG